MKAPSRRGFLKRLAALAPAWWLGSRAAGAADPAGAAAALPGDLLAALAPVVLPRAELGEEGVASATRGFARWAAGFEPVAELDHPYLWSDEIRYGPPDPRPGWTAQLEALEREARRRHRRAFAALAPGERSAILRRQLPAEIPERMPHPSEAPHVALALAAWFFSSARANDLCYRAAIGRHECRGLPEVANEPAPLATAGAVDEGR